MSLGSYPTFSFLSLYYLLFLFCGLFQLYHKNLVGPGGQGKSQSQGFIDKLCGLCLHNAVQIGNLASWYQFSFTDRMPCWSFLLFSMLQIVDSRPSWTVVSVLGELCSTAWIAISNMLWVISYLIYPSSL